MDERSQLIRLCVRGLEKKGLTDEAHKNRLKYELKQLDLQLNHDYFLKIYNSRQTFPNDHNLLIPYVLGVCSDFCLEKEATHIQGEWPDIDTDFLPDIRDDLKRVWAPEQFGKDNVCEISTYGTMGIKAAILDMTGVYGIPKDEIQAITVEIEDKDEEGHLLEWDKALEIYPAFNDYCNRFPHVAEAAKNLVGRNRQNGIHAGGLVISNTRLDDFVPLEVRSVNKDNKKGIVVSAWAEGQRTQELQAVGLIKFDYLVVDGLQQYGIPSNLVKERHGLKSICSLPGLDRDWSDISYLNDPKSLVIANNGDTRCIFQLGSGGLRQMLRQGGVTSFDDIAAYNALYRPGPLGMQMEQAYCRRKKGAEKYELHPLLQPILGPTYGVLVYQEQIMQMLNKVGNIPLIHCEKIRKAISKKKIAAFAKYKEQFIINGQKNLGATPEYLQNLWEQVEAFAGYGFNKAHSYAYSYISARQLWMMAHYPLEFYTSVLMCEKNTEEIKAEINDARHHKVPVEPIHINKSKQNFSICDDKIYFGFEKIKGIGVIPAKEIVEHQPYSSFVDFLNRYGTDVKVVKPLITLGAFDDEPYDKVTLYKFYEMYKQKTRKKTEQTKRNTDASQKYQNELNALLERFKEQLPADLLPQMAQFNEEAYALWGQYASSIEVEQQYNYKLEVRIRKVTAQKLLEAVRHKLEKSNRNFVERQRSAEKDLMSLDSFDAKRWPVDKEVMKLLSDTKEAEKTFYGFVWKHDLEESPDYGGRTIESFLTEANARPTIVGAIEVKILKVEHRTSKNNNTYYSIMVEDAHGQTARITMWSDDFSRFAPDLQVDNLVRMRVRPPSQGFKGLTFESPMKRDRHKLPKDRNEDYRLVTMKRGTPLPKVELDLSEFTFEEE